MQESLEQVNNAVVTLQDIIKLNRKEVYNNKKFDHLSKWLSYTSTQFKKEICKTPVKNFYYGKGSVLYVDFGINIGSEISGRHLVVVLDKKDSNYKNTLTVLPLSSHTKNTNLLFNDNPFNQAITFLKKQLNNINLSVQHNNKELLNYNLDLNNFVRSLSKYDDSLDKLVNENPKIEEIIVQFSKLFEKNIPQVELVPLVSNFSKILVEKKYVENDLKQNLFEMRKIKKSLDIYNPFSKEVHARIHDLTTISKLKIVDNIFSDPRYLLKLSENQMKDIELAIKKAYF